VSAGEEDEIDGRWDGLGKSFLDGLPRQSGPVTVPKWYADAPDHKPMWYPDVVSSQTTQRTSLSVVTWHRL
jgi:hypothetical protein